MSDDIILEDTSRGAGYPVIRRRNIGEKFVGGLIKQEWRDLQKKNSDGEWETVFKAPGKPAKQLVVHVLTKEATMPAGLGEDESAPTRGQIVRLILDRGAAAQFLQARDAYGGPLKVGLLIGMNTTHGIRYNATTYKELGQLDTQADLDDWRQSPANTQRKESVGMRGEIAIKDNDDLGFVEECKQAYHELNRQPDIALDDPFPGNAPVAAGAGVTDLF